MYCRATVLAQALSPAGIPTCYLNGDIVVCKLTAWGGSWHRFQGSAGLVLVDGVVHLDQESAVFEAMLAGWSRQ